MVGQGRRRPWENGAKNKETSCCCCCRRSVSLPSSRRRDAARPCYNIHCFWIFIRYKWNQKSGDFGSMKIHFCAKRKQKIDDRIQIAKRVCKTRETVLHRKYYTYVCPTNLRIRKRKIEEGKREKKWKK